MVPLCLTDKCDYVKVNIIVRCFDEHKMNSQHHMDKVLLRDNMLLSESFIIAQAHSIAKEASKRTISLSFISVLRCFMLSCIGVQSLLLHLTKPLTLS